MFPLTFMPGGGGGGKGIGMCGAKGYSFLAVLVAKGYRF